jgi:hypothetical protein
VIDFNFTFYIMLDCMHDADHHMNHDDTTMKRSTKHRSISGPIIIE